MDVQAHTTAPLPLTPATPAPAHEISLAGFCSVAGGDDIPCTAIELAIDRLAVSSKAAAAVGDKVIFSLPQIGLLEAEVTRVFDGGFAGAFESCPDSKLGLYLAWLNGSPEPGRRPDDRRGHERIVPIKKLFALSARGEPENMARAIDLSRSGIAFTTSKTLRTGEKVSIGAHAGMIVRLFDGGAAVRFDQEIDQDVYATIDLQRHAV